MPKRGDGFFLPELPLPKPNLNELLPGQLESALCDSELIELLNL